MCFIAKPAPDARFEWYFGNDKAHGFPLRALPAPLKFYRYPVKSAATSIDGALELSQGSDLPSTAPNPARIPILYVILGVLLVISIVPMYFYSAQVEAINRDRLKTNEMLLQNTVTRSLADDLSQHERSLRMMLANLSSAIQVASGGDIGSKNIERRSCAHCWRTLFPPPMNSPMPRC